MPDAFLSNRIERPAHHGRKHDSSVEWRFRHTFGYFRICFAVPERVAEWKPEPESERLAVRKPERFAERLSYRFAKSEPERFTDR
jgi:hypothetical protein